MSQRSLGKAWAQASPAEQKEFVRLFGSLIANAYMGRIEQYAGEPIEYVGERIEGDDAKVQSRVVTPKGSEVPIEYRLYRGTDGRWTVYDIYVDGFSLVGSYKAQFNRLLQRGTFADLLKQLRQKAGS
jgi:phospholipid transport system substrate-binding protein